MWELSNLSKEPIMVDADVANKTKTACIFLPSYYQNRP